MSFRAGCLVTLLAVAGAAGGSAQDGTFDPAFGSGGAQRVAFDRPGTDGQDVPAAVAVQPDGGIVLVGTAPETAAGRNAAIVRLLPDGAIDTSFVGGPFTYGPPGDDRGLDVLVEPSGSILVASARPNAPPQYAYIVARWSASGFQVEFSMGFTSAQPAIRLATDPLTGKTLVAMNVWTGTQDVIRVIRLEANLTVDPGYPTGGFYDIVAPGGGATYLADLEAMPDGRAVVAGYAFVTAGATDFFVARLTPTGTLDGSFGSGGRTVVPIDLVDFETDVAVALAVDALGRPLVAGNAYDAAFGDQAAVLVRLTSSGAVDATFNGGLPLVVADTNGDDSTNGVVVQSDGRIVVAGKVHGAASPMFFAARYLDDGSADWSFGSFGVFTANFPSSPNDDYAVAVALQGGRAILVGPAEWSAPDYDFGVLRLQSWLIFADGFEGSTAGAWSARVP